MRFCTSCGASGQASAAGPTTLVQPLADPGPPPRRRGLWRVLAALLVVGLVAGGIVLAFQLTGDDGQRASAKDSGSETSPSPSGSETDPATAETAAPPAASASTEAPAPAPVTCWDGIPATKLSECTAPTGRAGLEWVFPAMVNQRCSDKTTGGERRQGRQLLVECFGELPGGSTVRMNFSEWDSVNVSLAHYDEQGMSRTSIPDKSGQVMRYRWLGVANDGSYKAALMLAGHPLSVSVYVPAPEQRIQALHTVARMRPNSEILGIRNGS